MRPFTNDFDLREHENFPVVNISTRNLLLIDLDNSIKAVLNIVLVFDYDSDARAVRCNWVSAENELCQSINQNAYYRAIFFSMNFYFIGGKCQMTHKLPLLPKLW